MNYDKAYPSPSLVDIEVRIFPCEDEAYPVEIMLNDQQEFRGAMSAGVVSRLSGSGQAIDGQALFEFLLADDALRGAWAEARGQSSHRRVRLRLDANAPE